MDNIRAVVLAAGKGTRMNSDEPKCAHYIIDKTMIEYVIDSLNEAKVDDIITVVGYRSEVIEELVKGRSRFVYQKEQLGTAHAVLCAEEKLEGPVVVAFADTLFKADFKINPEDDGILWVKQIDDPSAFGVIKMNEKEEIIDFVEKPQTFVSDLAMIGVYYFKEAADLKTELNYLIENNIIKGGEYQLPDALRRLTEKGKVFKPGKVTEWLDCGNKVVTVNANQRILEFDREKNIDLVDDSAKLNNSVVIPPSFIGKNVVLNNSVVGPHVSIGADTEVNNSVIKNSIIQNNTVIEHINAKNSMIGNHANVKKTPQDLSVGDYTTMDI